MQIKWYSHAYNFMRPAYWFGDVDARPAALFRILFSLILLKDAVYHLFIARTFYSDRGIIPLNVLHNGVARSNRFSLMDAVHQPWMAQLFMLLWIVVLLALLLGYRTRLMAVLNFILIVSVHERNTLVLNGADTVLRVMSFWAIFLPMGLHYSVDAVRRRWRRYAWSHDLADLRVEDKPRTAFALPLRLAQIQIALIYTFTFILKLPGDTWSGGNALHYALQIRSLTLPTGDFLLANGPVWLLQFMTYFTLAMESSFLFLVFLPFFQPWLRAIGLAMGAALHLGIAVLMSIPNFSMAMIFSYVLFFPAAWILTLENWSKGRGRGRPLGVRFNHFDRPLALLFATTHAGDLRPIPTGEEPTSGYDGWALEGDMGYMFHHADAWRLAAARLPLSRFYIPLLTMPVVRRVVWSLARLVVGVGTLPCEPEAAALPERPHAAWRWVARGGVSAVLLPMIALVLWWNLYTIKEGNGRLVDLPPDPARSLVQYSGMWQSWGMFAPFPTTIDGWAVVTGRFEDGTEMDLLTGRPLMHGWTRWLWGPQSRWKKFVSNMRRDQPQEVLEAWGGYYCREYNTVGNLPLGHRLATLEIKFYARRSYAPGEEENPLEVQDLWRHWCFDEYQY